MDISSLLKDLTLTKHWRIQVNSLYGNYKVIFLPMIMNHCWKRIVSRAETNTEESIKPVLKSYKTSQVGQHG